MKRLLICIDYDGTFTVIPKLLTEFIKSAKREGHLVICATMRYRSEGIDPALHELCGDDNVIFTGRKAKLPFLKEMDIIPDIWIDDNPLWLFKDG